MRLQTTYLHSFKTAFHIAQGLFIFIGGCLTLAVLTKSGGVGAPTSYYFALCWLSMPALIYLAMVPAWKRTQRFMNAYAFVAVDALFTILWFAAFVSVAVWNSSAMKKGAKAAKISTDDASCGTFAYGSNVKCNVSKATVGFGVVITILFALTTAISGYYLNHWLHHHVIPCVPGAGAHTQLGDYHDPTALDAAGKDPWSADTADIDIDLAHQHGGSGGRDSYSSADDDEDDNEGLETGGGSDTGRRLGRNKEDDRWALLNQDEEGAGGRWGSGIADTAYHGAAGVPSVTMPEPHVYGGVGVGVGGAETEYRGAGAGAVPAPYPIKMPEVPGMGGSYDRPISPAVRSTSARSGASSTGGAGVQRNYSFSGGD